MTIFRVLFGAFFFGVIMIWGATVLTERDRCTQIEKSTAPVRLVMDGLRFLDRKLNWVGSNLDWLSWRVRADEAAQHGLIKVFYGDELVCSTKPNQDVPIQSDFQTRPDVEVRGPNPFH